MGTSKTHIMLADKKRRSGEVVPFAETQPFATDKTVTLWDATPGCQGFGIIITRGAKTWVIRASHDGKVKQFSIGAATPGGLSVTDARAKAGEWREVYRRTGQDPRQVEREAQQSKDLTLGEAVEMYKRRLGDAGRKATAIDGFGVPLTLYLGDWQDRPLRTIRADECTDRFADIANGRGLGARRDGGRFAGKTADGTARTGLRGGLPTARIVMRCFRTVWNFTRKHREDIGLGETPTRRIEGLNRVAVRHLALTEDKLPAFVATARAYPNPVHGDLALLLLFTGLRIGEASALRWDEIDLERGELHIPAARMKAAKALDVPLTGLAVEVLRRRRAVGLDARGFVFPGGRGGHAAGLSGRLVDRLAAEVGPFSAHDLRKVFTTAALEADVPLQVVEVLTAHRPAGVTLTHYYNPTPSALRRSAAKIDARMRAVCGLDAGAVV